MLILVTLQLLTLIGQLRVTNVDERLENARENFRPIALCILDGNIGFLVYASCAVTIGVLIISVSNCRYRSTFVGLICAQFRGSMYNAL